MVTHTVKQGDHLAKIAAQYGFSDYRTIWDDAANADLKKKRKNPNVLLPGDIITIPDRKDKVESRATDHQHLFKVTFPMLGLRVAFKNVDDKPIAHAECDLTLDNGSARLNTDSEGRIEQEIQRTTENGLLIFADAVTAFPAPISVKIGHLDPVEERSGQIGRLNNLGYSAGDLDESGESRKDDPADQLFRSAVEEFQCDHGLKVDGVCGATTQAKLKDIHGC